MHEVLALPAGAIVRYEYKRYLFKPEAAAMLDGFANTPSGLPADTLLMYGEKRSYRKGDKDPQEMLRWRDSVFTPTRSARIVGVARMSGASTEEDVFHMHLEMRGFVDPHSPLIAELVQGLEADSALPFGVKHQEHIWIALLPDSLRKQRDRLLSDNQQLWSRVVERLINLPTQFCDDAFWRVVRIETAAGTPVALEKRSTNEPNNPTRYQHDYPVEESKGYQLVVQTYSPDAHGHQIPGNATLAMTAYDDPNGLIKLSTRPMALVPNETKAQPFSIDTNDTLGARYAGVLLETQIPDYEGTYPRGSLCHLTFAIRKKIWRYVAGGLFLLIAAALSACATITAWGPDTRIGCAVGAAFALALSGLVLTGRLKIGK